MSKKINPYDQSRSVLVLSYGDIVGKAEEMGIKLDEKQIQDIYDRFDAGKSDVIMDGFWTLLEVMIEDI